MKLKGKLMQYLAAFAASLSLFTGGTFYGWINSVITLLLSPDTPVPMTSIQSSWIASLPELGSILSSVPAGYLANRIGRKNLLLCSAPVSLLSWVAVYYATKFYLLVVVRLVQGLLIGIICTALPIYISEIAEPSVRGSMGNFYTLSSTSGMVYTYAIGPFVAYKTFAILLTIPCWLILILFYWFHESPYYLVMVGKTEEAKASLISFRDSDVGDEFTRILSSAENERAKKDTIEGGYNSTVWRKGMAISLVATSTAYLSGYVAFISYSSTIFIDATGMKLSSDILTLGMGILLCLANFPCIFMLDKWGRVPTLLLSYWGCFICNTMIAVYYFLRHLGYNMKSVWWIMPVIAAALSPSFSLFGVSASKAYQSELFSTVTRGFSSSINTMVAGVTSISVLMYSSLQSENLIYVNFIIFAMSSLVGAIFIQFFGPETKNKSFDEIQLILSKSNVTNKKMSS